MSNIRDIVQLKLQKKLLQEQLNSTDDKIHKLSNILVKKRLLKHPLEEEIPISNLDRTLSELKLPLNPIRAKPKFQSRDVYASQPVPISNERILGIRQQFLIHTTGRKEVQSKIEKKKERELRSIKVEKKAPKIKVPESMLPNRYLRGELPCTIGL